MPSDAPPASASRNVSRVSRPAIRMMPAAPANRLNTPMTASADSNVSTYGCALLRPTNRKAITEPTSSSATASTMPMLPPLSPVRSTAVRSSRMSWLTSCAAIDIRFRCARISAPVCPRRRAAQGVKCLCGKGFFTPGPPRAGASHSRSPRPPPCSAQAGPPRRSRSWRAVRGRAAGSRPPECCARRRPRGS